MAEVKVLIGGYAKEEGDTELASSTVILIKDEDLNIIVDPGMNRELLLKALEKEKLNSENINYIFLTHYHMDHSLLTGIFVNAKVWYTGDIYSFDGKIKEREDAIFGGDIEIIKTPGHNSDCRSLLVKTNEGIIVIAGDVIWWEDDEEQKVDRESLIEHADPYATDMETLKESRKKILEMADYIIPGHGKMFEVQR